MSEQVKWAEDYIKQYDFWIEQLGTVEGNVTHGSMERTIYELAKAIIADTTKPSQTEGGE